MKKSEINEMCNTITKSGKRPFALVRTTAELRERPADCWEIFNNDQEPEVNAIFDSEEKALEALGEKKMYISAPIRSNGGYDFFDCEGWILAGMEDEFEEGKDWAINLDALLECAKPEQTKGDRLRELRKNTVGTLKEAERLTGIAYKAIYRFETDERDLRNATGETILKLAKAYGVSMEDLMNI